MDLLLIKPPLLHRHSDECTRCVRVIKQQAFVRAFYRFRYGLRVHVYDVDNTRTEPRSRLSTDTFVGASTMTVVMGRPGWMAIDQNERRP